MPMLILERMHSSLTSCLENHPNIPLHFKERILLDVTLGIRFLHERDEPIIHRDLSANNVLMTEDLRAKISDLGVARIVPNDILKKLTVAPGTTGYMPPEALVANPDYGTKLDIFSLGILILHVILQKWPLPHKEANAPDPLNPGRLIAYSEVERRENHFKEMDPRSPLTPLVEQCLSNHPTTRPTAKKVAEVLESLVTRSSSLFLPTLETCKEKEKLGRKKEAMEKHSQDIESQLHTILQDMHGKFTLNEPELDKMLEQLQSLVRSTRSVLYNSEQMSFDSSQRRLVVAYKTLTGSDSSTFLNISSASPSLPHPLSVTVCVPINIPFSGTYVKTIVSKLTKPLAVAVSGDQVFVVDHEGWNGIHICSISGSTETRAIVESSSKADYFYGMPLERCWHPSGVAIDAEKNIILVDTESHRILKFCPTDGTLLGSSGRIMEPGDGLGYFNRPVGVCVSRSGEIYVCDRSNHRIQILDRNLLSRRAFGRQGKGECEFHNPWDIALDSKGNIYISDCANVCVKVFSSDFTFLRQIGSIKDKMFYEPTGICIDVNDYLYVADKTMGCVKIFNPSGDFVMKFGSRNEEREEFKFNKPMGIAVAKGRLFVADSYNGRVLMFE